MITEKNAIFMTFFLYLQSILFTWIWSNPFFPAFFFFISFLLVRRAVKDCVPEEPFSPFHV